MGQVGGKFDFPVGSWSVGLSALAGLNDSTGVPKAQAILTFERRSVPKKFDIVDRIARLQRCVESPGAGPILVQEEVVNGETKREELGQIRRVCEFKFETEQVSGLNSYVETMKSNGESIPDWLVQLLETIKKTNASGDQVETILLVRPRKEKP